jgi:hypothetical protein
VQVILLKADPWAHELAGVHVAPGAGGHVVLLLLCAVRLAQAVQVNLQIVLG